MTESSTRQRIVQVHTAAPYEVVVGHDLLDRLPGLVGDQARRAGVIYPESCTEIVQWIAELLAASGVEPLLIKVPDAETAKTAAVAADIWAQLGQAGFTRSDVVIGVGGGATTDLAGFIAATWLRGVKLVTVSTTILGMVDAAVGGKTGINTAEGKNLVGAFYEPAGVLCDLSLLTTLPEVDRSSGLAEVIKCGFIADPEILTLVEADPKAALDVSAPVVAELVERAITVKARVVERDLKEATSTGRVVGRESLNYGHTLGHAIERREGYRWRHGQAISVGMVFVAHLSRLAGRLDEATAVRHGEILRSVGLPTSYDASAFAELVQTMGLDKKTRGSTLRFVILDSLARASILEGPSEDLLRAAYAEVS